MYTGLLLLIRPPYLININMEGVDLDRGVRYRDDLEECVRSLLTLLGDCEARAIRAIHCKSNKSQPSIALIAIRAIRAVQIPIEAARVVLSLSAEPVSGIPVQIFKADELTEVSSSLVRNALNELRG